MAADRPWTDQVHEGIDQLESHFGPFPVNQTTLSVTSEAYEDALDRAEEGIVDVYLRVRNEEGKVLSQPGEGAVPRCAGDPNERFVDSIEETVREVTGVACVIDGVARATIAGVHDPADTDAPTVYRLLVLVEATYEQGTPDGWTWTGEESAPEII